MHKKLSQLTFGDSWIKTKKLSSRLDRINALVDWKAIADLLAQIYNKKHGRPSFPPVTLFKCLLLQGWYSLSDYQLEEAIDDRLSFRRFIGIGASETAPDHSTVSRFRTQLIAHQLEQALFTEFDRQLDQQGLLVKKGTLVDATLIEAAVKKPDQRKDGRAGKSAVDPEAEWVRKGKKRFFGFKGHVGVDAVSGFIRKTDYTRSTVHDGHRLSSLITGEEQWAFADKAYFSKANNQLLRDRSIKNGLMRKGCRERKLTATDRLRNRLIAKHRSAVERVFGTLKRFYHGGRARYRGLKKNGLHFNLLCICFNLKKMEVVCT